MAGSTLRDLLAAGRMVAAPGVEARIWRANRSSSKWASK